FAGPGFSAGKKKFEVEALSGSPDVVLVERERCFPSVPLLVWIGFCVAAHDRPRAGCDADSAVALLPFIVQCLSRLSQLSMGHSDSGNGVPRDLRRAVRTLAEVPAGDRAVTGRPGAALVAGLPADVFLRL